ncbi:MAG: hypothetical protein ABSG55_09565 [Dehalococcoidia bacterium]|jgi:hypothetical protein
MDEERARTSQGSVPFRLRVGVTGHRRLDDEEALAAQVRRTFQRLRALVPSSPLKPVLFTAVSSLAEGADRLVTREMLRDQGTRLEAALPLPSEEYLRDFESDASKREFNELLARADVVTGMPPAASREEAYQRAGRYIVEHCDVLVALWDGQPPRGQGGTAEIVEYARKRRLPLFWIATKGQPEISEEMGQGIGPRGP